MCVRVKIMTCILVVMTIVITHSTHPAISLVSKNDVLSNRQCDNKNRMQIFCYVSTWFLDIHPNRLLADRIDPYMCSHIVMSSFGFIQNGTEWSFPYYYREEDLLADMIKISHEKPNCQYLSAVGSYEDYNYPKFEKLATDTVAQERFVNEVVKLVRRQGVNGVDFIWNFIGYRENVNNTGPGDLSDLKSIVSALCSRMKTEGLLCIITLTKAETLDVEQSKAFKDNLRSIIIIADFVNIWATEVTRRRSTVAKLVPQSLLIPEENEEDYKDVRNYSINFIVDFYKSACNYDSQVINKLALVLPLQFQTYGIPSGFNLSVDITGDTNGSGNNVVWNIKHQYPYFQVCKDLNGEGYNLTIMELSGGVPVAVGQFINHPNNVVIPTITERYIKAQVAYAHSQGLGGVSVFVINSDDIHGWCSNQSYPILNAISDELINCSYN